MYDLQPHRRWRADYRVEEDKKTPFFGEENLVPKKIYNYLINANWDSCGSSTLYLKILFADYDRQYAIIELIGEWNDTLHNDIMCLKRNVIERLLDAGISKYILVMENVLNFHADDDDYYAEWLEECQETDNKGIGWICMINSFDHVSDEMAAARLQRHVYVGHQYNGIEWRMISPKKVLEAVEQRIALRVRTLD
jgi:hypothetical protein